MKKSFVLLAVLFFVLNSCSIEKSQTIKLAAGSGQPGFKDGNPADLNKPIRLTPYTNNSVIFADINNHAIRIATIDGEVTTLAGGPDKEGYQDGSASQAKFKSPHGVAYDKKNKKVYVAGAGNHVIRVINLSENGEHQVTTLAGIPGTPGYEDGKADSAMFISPHAVILRNDGGVVVADIGNARLRLIKDGRVSTIAGSGETGSIDGLPEQATFNYAMDLVLDDSDILLADAGSHLIRKIVPGKEVTTLTLQDTLSTPHGIAIDESKNIYIADMGTHRVLKIDKDGHVKSIAGTGKIGNGLEELNKPAAVLVHAGYLWIADLNNHQIKVIRIKN
jgi:DNA-binding beta-propeller fold protein YncE